MMQAVTDKDFSEKTASGLSVTDFWATWCGPCKMQSPILEEMSEESDGSVDYYKIDVDENPATSQQHGVMSIPTLLIQKDGEVVDTLIGVHSREQIEAALEAHK